MRMLTITALAVLATLAAADSEFSKFPGEARLSGRPAQPRMDLPQAREFRTMLRREAVQGPNFNGHYRIAHWGQGTGVIMWAIIDLSSGRVWFAPDIAGMCPNLDAEDDDLGYFENRIDSALFFLNTCDGRGSMKRIHNLRQAYVWRNGEAVLLREESLK